MDDAATAQVARTCLNRRRYDLVIVRTTLADADVWELVQSIGGTTLPPISVILVTDALTWTTRERAQELGCLGVLEMPFNPQQVIGLLQQV